MCVYYVSGDCRGLEIAQSLVDIGWYEKYDKSKV